MSAGKKSLPRSAKIQAKELLSTLRRVRTKTDGCTSSPDFNFVQCCIEHDINYRDNPNEITRADADKRLRKCIQAKGFIILPWLYWSAVRLFGGNAWKNAASSTQEDF